MEPTNADLQKSFEEHARHDAAFQDETRDTTRLIQEALERIESKLDPENDNYILKEMEKKMDAVWSLVQGFDFVVKAIKYTAGISGGLAIIIGSFFALIRFIK